jgi:EF hand
MKKFFGVFGVAIALCGTTAYAKTDTNGDGFHSREEMVSATFTRYEKKFHQADANKDGRVTLDEVSGKKLSVARAADTNKDGVITLAEARAHVEQSVDKRIAKKDLDKDGRLSKEERKRKATS